MVVCVEQGVGCEGVGLILKLTVIQNHQIHGVIKVVAHVNHDAD